MDHGVQERELFIPLFFCGELDGGVHCIESVEEIRQVRPGWYYSEDVVHVAEPDHVPSHDVTVMVGLEGFHEQLGKDC